MTSRTTGSNWTYPNSARGDLHLRLADRHLDAELVEEFEYDNEGNMIARVKHEVTTTYSWSDENRLVRVQGPGSVDIGYTYDMAGRMLTRDDGAVTTFTWDGFDCIREQTGMSTTTYCIPEGVLTSFIRDGDRFDVHTDHVMSVRMVTDENGDIVLRREFDAFGSELTGNFDNVPGGFDYGFVGALGVRRDGLTGLTWMRNRWYAPQQGRFLSRDPIGLAGGANLYSYCRNTPANAVDPRGLEVILWVRITKNKTGGDWGHEWLQIKGPGYDEGFGAYPGRGIVDENTENNAEATRKRNDGNSADMYRATVFHTSPSDDALMIKGIRDIIAKEHPKHPKHPKDEKEVKECNKVIDEWYGWQNNRTCASAAIDLLRMYVHVPDSFRGELPKDIPRMLQPNSALKYFQERKANRLQIYIRTTDPSSPLPGHIMLP